MPGHCVYNKGEEGLFSISSEKVNEGDVDGGKVVRMENGEEKPQNLKCKNNEE